MRVRYFRTRMWLALALGATLQLSLSAQTTAERKEPASGRWEKEIGAFETADLTNAPPEGAVLFIGGSSIRLWTQLAQAFPGHRVINRGFGGSELADSVDFAGRIVTPYKPKLVLLYAGDNDIAAGKSPERVCADFKAFVSKLHSALPDTRIGYIAIKPCPARERYLNQVKAANHLIQDYTATDSRLVFIDIFSPMLTKDGQPRADLCIQDGLHPNASCYELWASLIRPVLDKYDPLGSSTK